jgi:transcriptional regulator with XRE-family HTH domain
MPTPHNVSFGVSRSLKILGQNIKEARLRRALPASVVAARAFTSRPTLQRVEAGDAGVSMGIYAAVLQALGLLDGLAELADARNDETGLNLSASTLPKRARLKRSRGEP